MAELNVQPKSKTPAWIWIVLGFVVLLVLYFLLRGNEPIENTTEPGGDPDINVTPDRRRPSSDLKPLELWNENEGQLPYEVLRAGTV